MRTDRYRTDEPQGVAKPIALAQPTGVPRYYFDFASDGSVRSTRDAIGLDFVSSDDARAHAMTLLPATSVELPMKVGEFKSWKVIVRDDAGEIIGRLIMAIINDPLDPDGDRVLRPVGTKG